MDFDQELSPTNLDEIIGDNSSESIEGEKLNDDINGGGGSDTVNGGAGDDQIDGGKGDDQIEGGLGADTLEGGKGDDILDGGKGDDQIEGGLGADTLEGGKGDDILDGGAGDDLLVGGQGDDTYVISLGDDTITDYDPENDTIVLSRELIDAGITEDNIQRQETVIDGKKAVILSYSIKGDTHTTTVIGVEDGKDIEIESGELPEGELPETPGNVIIGTPKDDSAKTDAASPDGFKFLGTAGSDLMSGMEGDDTIDGGLGDDVLDGGKGRDTFILSEGYDFIPDADVLKDTIVTPNGYTSELLGEPTAVNEEGYSTFAIVLKKNGSTKGTTVVQFKPSKEDIGQPVFPPMPGLPDVPSGELPETPGNVIIGTPKDDSAKTDAASPDGFKFLGTAGSDLMSGMEGDDTIDGGLGDDVLDGGKGRDTFILSEGYDFIPDADVLKDTIVTPNGYTSELLGEPTAVNEEGYSTFAIVLKKNGSTKGTTVVQFKPSKEDIGQPVFPPMPGLPDVPSGELPETPGNVIIGTPKDDSAKTDAASPDGFKFLGTAGSDLMSGMEGDDTIDGGLGDDVLDGGKGRDTFILSEGYDFIPDADVLKDTIVTPNGYTSELLGEPTAVNEEGYSTFAIVLKKNGSTKGTTVVQFKPSKEDIGQPVFPPMPGLPDVPSGELPETPGNVIIGTPLDDSAKTDAASPDGFKFLGTAGSDLMSGMEGDDTIDGGLGDDVLDGGKGRDTFILSEGYDFIPDADVLKDTIVTPNGYTSELLGEPTAVNEEGYSTFAIVLKKNGSTKGTTVVQFKPSKEDIGQPVFPPMPGLPDVPSGELPETPGNVIIGTPLDDSAKTDAASPDGFKFLGTAGSDLMSGMEGDDTIDGGLGDDVLDGGKGRDTFILSEGYDFIPDADVLKDTIVTPNGYTSELLGEPTAVNEEGYSTFAIVLKKNGSTKGTTVVQFKPSKEDIGQPVFPPMPGLPDVPSGELPETPGNVIIGTPLDDSAKTDAASPDGFKFLGTAGSDLMSGMEGDDTIDGGLGDDVLDGGKGRDTFILSEGYDFIPDADVLKDTIVTPNGYTSELLGEPTAVNEEGYSTFAIVLKKNGSTKGTTVVQFKPSKEDIGQPVFPPMPGLPDVPSGELPETPNGGGDGGGGNGGSGNGGSDGGGEGGGDGGNGGDGGGGTIDGGLEEAPGSDNSGGGNSGGDGTIDGTPINPPIEPGPDQPDDNNELRVVDVEQKPKQSAFEAIKRGSQNADTVIGSDGIDKLRGQEKNDLIKGQKGDDYLYGENGADSLIGGKGADVLQGGNGKDELKGGGASDVLYGGNNADVLTGNGGKDIFVLSKGQDVITDFNVKKDSIGIVYALDLKLKQKGDDLLIKGNDNVRTLLQGIDKEDFLANQDDLSTLPIVEVNAF